MPDLLADPAQLPGIAFRRRLQQLRLGRPPGRFGQVLQLAGDGKRVLEGDVALLDRLDGRLQRFQLAGQGELAIGRCGGDVGVGADPVQGGVLTELVEGLPAIEGGHPAGGLQLEEIDRGADELELGVNRLQLLEQSVAMLENRSAWKAPPTPIHHANYSTTSTNKYTAFT